MQKAGAHRGSDFQKSNDLSVWKLLGTVRPLARTLPWMVVLLLGGLFFGTEAQAQQGTIRGVVTDSTTGGPLPGVNVVLVGEQRGTSTDADGSFTITNVEPGTYTVRATFIGYADETVDGVQVEPSETVSLDLTLRPTQLGLDEVTVTALGVEEEQRALTSAQQTVETANIAKAREVNVSQSLSGRVAGLSVNQAATGVGGQTRVVLRGNRSIAGDNQVLYVLNGVPIRGDVSDLNPDDIQSIEVLKGANAAALYGTEAQNGAVLITTKGAQSGEVQASYNGSVMAREANILTDYQNQFGQGSGGEFSPSSEFSWGPRMEGQMVDFWSPAPDATGEERALTPQPNNVSDILETGVNTSHNVSANVGTESVQSRFSYTFTKSSGVVPRNDLSRHNVSVSANSDLSESLSLNGRVSYMNEVTKGQLPTGENFANPMRHIRRMPRNIQLEDARQFEFFTEDGVRRQNFWNPGSNGGANPFWTIHRNLNQETRERVIAQASMDYSLTDHLNFTVRGSYDGEHSRSEEKFFNDTFVIADNGQFDLTRQNAFELRGTGLVNYQRDLFSNFSIDARGGVEKRVERNEGLAATTGQALTIPNFFAINNTQNVEVSQIAGSPRTVNSVFGSTEFGWNDAVFLDFTARNDWSSTLPSDNQSFFYPSVGLSAVLTDPGQRSETMRFHF